MQAKRREPEIVLRDGKPAAVIIDIDEYREMLELLEDKEDLAALAELRAQPLSFRSLEAFLTETEPDVSNPT